MEIALRQGLVGLAVVLGTLSPLACSGTVDPIKSGEPTGEDKSLLKEGACFSESLGGDTSCKPPEFWKEYAEKACAARGLSISDFGLGGECKGGFAEAKYACCKQPPKPLPPKPGPNPGACFGDAQGGPTSCKPAEVWTKYASQLCTAKGSRIAHIGFAEECEKGAFRYTKYECCDGSEPLPPPPEPRPCKTAVLEGNACQPNGLWKEKAFDLCNREKLTLVDLSVDQACSDDASSHAKVTCCVTEPPRPEEPPQPLPPEKQPKEPPRPEEPPQPQPPPQACSGHGLEGQCHDAASWKQIAWETCAKEGLTLTSLDVGGGCPDGGASAAKFTCCK